VRIAFLTWTPSQTLVHLLDQSGYLEEYKVLSFLAQLMGPTGFHFGIGSVIALSRGLPLHKGSPVFIHTQGVLVAGTGTSAKARGI